MDISIFLKVTDLSRPYTTIPTRGGTLNISCAYIFVFSCEATLDNRQNVTNSQTYHYRNLLSEHY